MNTTVNNTFRTLTIVYYGFYVSTLAFTFIGYQITKDIQTSIMAKSEIGMLISSFTILYLLLSIPLSLGGFYRLSQKWKALEDKQLKLKNYTKFGIVRLALIGSALEISIIAFFLLRSEMSMIYCAGIAAIALIFCKPSIQKISSELDIDEE